MSLESLEICGIRGFSPDHSCKVDISSPLTIITGPTGSGKTAVLEALQVAVSGFTVQTAKKKIPLEINDPNIHARSETVASVRLVFQGADNVKYTAERQFKLKSAKHTANKSSPFSTDRQKLTSSATSIHPDISTLPELLQVSNPVWDSLIFVYQEDALWPLGEKVTDHMDKITRLDGHSKVLHVLQDGMREVRTKTNTTASELETLEKDFENFEEDKGRFEQEEERLKEISQQCIHLEIEITDLDTRVKNQKRRDELKASIRELQKSKRSSESEMQRIERRWLTRYRPGQSKGHLVQKIDAERSFLRDKRVTTCNVEDELRDAPELIANIRILVDDLEMKKTHLKNQAIKHKQQRKDIDSLKNRLKTKFSLAQEFASSNVDHGLPPLDADDEEWTTALESLDQTSVREEDSLSELFINIRKKEEEVGGKKNEWEGGKKELDRIYVKIVELEKLLPNSNRISEQQEREALQTAKERALEAERNWKQIETKRIQREAKLREEVELLENAEWALDRDVNELVEEEGNAKEQEDALRTLEKRFQYATKGCRESLEKLSKRLTESASDLEAKTGLQLSKWRQSFDDISSAEKAEKESKSLSRIKNELSEERESFLHMAKEQGEEHQKQLHEASFQEEDARKWYEKSLKELTTTVEKAKLKIPSIRTLLSEEDRAQFERIFPSSSIPSSTYPFSATHEQVKFIRTILANTNVEIQKAKEDIWRWETGLRHVTQDFELFRKNFQCPACGVQGSDDAGIEKMTKFFERRMSEYKDPQNLKRVEDNLRRLNQKENSVRDFEQILSESVSDSSKSEEAKEKHGKAESQLRERETEMEKLLDVDEREKMVVSSSLEKHMVEECSKSVQSLKDASCELEELNAQSFELKRRPSSDISTELKYQRAKLQGKSSELRTKRKELDNCREDEPALEGAKSAFDKQKKKKDILESLLEWRQKADDCRQNNEQLQDSFRQAQDDLKEISEGYAKKKASVSKLQNMRKDGLEAWRRSLEKLGSFDPEANSLKRLEKYLKIWNSVLSYQEEKRRSLTELETLEGNLEVCVVKKKIADIDRDIREKQQNYEGEDDVLGVNLQRTLREVENERERKIAEEKIQEKVVKELQRKMDEYKVVLEKLNPCQIKKTVMGYSLEDLKSVYLAREKALKLGHKIKMASINRAIMKLWNSSYRGTNIDEIRIEAYDEKANKRGKTPKRFFQYHVEMRQGQSWVDLKGRCSTGQKYFACLIVRLALVDTFCKDLSFLVLDQPTANVDHEHAGYIGRAINTFLTSRRRRGNFHLLLATTDRELADMLDVRECCDHCYVITEDESGYSRAERRNLEEL